MSTNTHRSSFLTSTSSSLARRQASSSSSSSISGIENNVGVNKAAAKKRAPLGDLTNQRNGIHKGTKKSANISSTLVPCSKKGVKPKKETPTSNKKTGFSGNGRSATNVVGAGKIAPIIPIKKNVPIPKISVDVSPSKSDANSVSMDEDMSTCDSFKSPDVEYVDNCDVHAIDSINRKAVSSLYISDRTEIKGSVCGRKVIDDMVINDKIVNVDDNLEDPQLCATIACDIYKHLRESEAKKRPATDYMVTVQKDINSSMRAILIDWLVEVAEEYRLIPETLYLTVNYIDRYLSGNVMTRQRLQLLGVACMMIASKYEEICAPQVEEFVYITDNTYFREEVLEMESSVLNYLKFEMTAPTPKCFLRRFSRAAQGLNEVPSMQLECLACYISELSLLEYNMLTYTPSIVAASSIFLARYILQPSKLPWNATLQHYTLYKPSDLCACVSDLHRLCCSSHDSTLPAIREKYSQHKYKFVAKKYCPPTIPQEYFQNQGYY